MRLAASFRRFLAGASMRTERAIPPSPVDTTGLAIIPQSQPVAAVVSRSLAQPRQRSNRALAAILMSGALLSKMLGFAREIMMAHVLGASLVADSFRGAITAVLIPLAFLQNETVPAILIPLHKAAQATGNAARRLAALTIALTAVAFLLMLGLEALGAWWVDAVVSGFLPEGQAMTLDFVRIMALAMPASTMLNCLAAGEIALNRSRLTNVRASLLNVSVLVGIVLVGITGRFILLAWSFTLAFNALALWASWSLWCEGILDFTRLRPALVLAELREFLRRMRPLLALPIAEQGQVWVERILASRLATGAVASLDYARTLTDSALLLISQPMGLTVLSRLPTKNTRAQVAAIARPVLAFALPISAFVVAFAPDIVRLVFHRGAFTDHGVLLTSQALRGIAVGLWATTLGWILLRILNSAGRNGAAALILVCAYGANIGLNLLTSGLQQSSGAGLLLLGLGETLRSIVLLGGVMLALPCRRMLIGLILLAMLPAAVMGLLGWQIDQLFSGALERLVVGGLACAACIGLAAALLMRDVCRTVFRQLGNRYVGGA